MTNQTSMLTEQRVVGFALGHPGFDPARIAGELAQPRWGGTRLSANGVWRVLRRHRLSTRAKRYGLVAGYTAHRRLRGHSRSLNATRTSTTPASWSSSIACASADWLAPRHRVGVHRYRCGLGVCLGDLQVTRRNPSATWTSVLAARWLPTVESRRAV
jgi:hypothetical protein